MIVFPMAGLSSRFTKAGYTVPKYMLPLGQGSMFEKAVTGFRSQFQSEPFLFICRDVAETEAFIRSEFARMPDAPATWQVVVLEAATSGQAETVYQGLKAAGVAADVPITIFNIDSHHQDFTYPDAFDLSEIDGYLEVFRAPGEHWSFVLPDPAETRPGAVAEVAEKRRISDLCSSGLYYFRQAGLFMQLFEQTLTQNPEDLDGGERYVAPLYNLALEQGCDIRFAEISKDSIAFTGTPDEYYAQIKAHGPSIAFCISGQLRGAAEHQETVSALAAELGADVFISTWDKRGRKSLEGDTGINQLCRVLGADTALMIPAKLFPKMGEAFPKTNAALLHSARSVEDELRAVYPEAVIDTEEAGQLSLFLETQTADVNSMRMLYKLWRCNQLKRRREEQRGRPYDYVIRFRPDCLPDVKNFLQSRVGNDRVRVPLTHQGRDFVGDIFWMGSSEQDDYLASLFGRSIQFRQTPWTNIHRELADLINGAPFDYEKAPRLYHILDDATPAEHERTRGVLGAELRDPNALIETLLGGAETCTALADLLDMVGHATPDQISDYLKRYIKQGTPSVFILRSALVLALYVAQKLPPDVQGRAIQQISGLIAREFGGVDGPQRAVQITDILDRHLYVRHGQLPQASTDISSWLNTVCDDISAVSI